MSRDDIAQDPEFVELEKKLLEAVRAFRRANLELRAAYLEGGPPARATAADLQGRAHQALHAAQDAIAGAARYGWALTPASGTVEETGRIAAERAAQQARLAARRVDPLKVVEERIALDDGSSVTIVLKGDGRTRTRKAE
jgi:hypothetical protein